MDHQAFAQLLGNYGEFFGAVAVLATLLYLSVQVRQANSIARTQTVMQLHTEFNEINSARFTNPEVARICLLVQYPDQHETTDIDVSMIRGMAYHIHNIMWSAQSAYENSKRSGNDVLLAGAEF
jgi:hypothetical protein